MKFITLVAVVLVISLLTILSLEIYADSSFKNKCISKNGVILHDINGNEFCMSNGKIND